MRKFDIQHPVITFPFMVGGNRAQPRPSTKHIENTEALIRAYKIEVRYNLMRHSLELEIPGFVPEAERAENATVHCFRSLVQRQGLSTENSLGHLQILADSYHPVRDWINSVPWDGVDRWQDFLATVELQDDKKDALTKTLLRRWMVSAVTAVMPEREGGRPFTPQGVLTFQGDQGIGKTEWFKSLAPADKDWICTGRVLDPHNRDSIQQLTGYWISELGELDATFKKSEVTAMKAFITQPVDVYRSAYALREERIPRRTMLGASVNPQAFLADETGNRRWWTVAVKRLHWGHKINVQQLWAQIAVAAAAGEKWWLDSDEISELNESNHDHEVMDPLVAELWETWRVATVSEVGKHPRVKLSEVWNGLPNCQGRMMDKRQAKDLAEALRKMGALNEGKSKGLSTYRVERINPLPTFGSSSSYGSFGGFNPGAYKE